MITKTKVGELKVGQTLDFDAHTGCSLYWQDSIKEQPGAAAKPYAEWVKATGQATITSMAAEHDYYNNRAAKRHIVIGLDNGHYLSLHSSSKLPVLA